MGTEAAVRSGEAGPNHHDRLKDLLDLSKTKFSAAPKGDLTPSERWMKYLGFPGGLAAFAAVFFMPAPAGLTAAGQAALACFLLALVWWVTEPVPTFVTSLTLMVLLVFLDVRPSDDVLGVLGLDVIWLNVMAFVLSSILIKTNLAKRLALGLVSRWGTRATPTLLAFLVLQLALAPLIPATAARSVITLPILLVVSAVYGASAERPNNVGRNLFLQSLMGINIFSSGFMTGSTANLIALSFLFGMAGKKIYYTDWLFASLPVALTAMAICGWIGPKLLFRIEPENQAPRIAGGMETFKAELASLGPLSFEEKRGAAIFGVVIFLWVTDRFHMGWFGFEVSPVLAAIVGGILAFLPRIGLLKWSEADIPWNLMLFSAGAYAGGLALDATGAARWVIGKIFAAASFGPGTSFWPVYMAVIAINLVSHYFFTSKTMRTIIMIPFVIGIAQQLGWNPVWLALPSAFTIDWVIGLPISGKPNVIFLTTGQYSVLDNVKYGAVMTVVAILLFWTFGFTWFRVLGVTPGFGS